MAAKLLDKVPADVFDGQPLRFRKTTDGVVVFSIGPDGNYAADVLDVGSKKSPAFPRFEFRLWDENKRRQAAAK